MEFVLGQMKGSRNQKQFSQVYDIYVGITTRPQWVGWLTTGPIRWASKNKRQTPENSCKRKLRVDTKIIGELQGRGNQKLRGQQAEGSKPANWWTEKLNEGIVRLHHIFAPHAKWNVHRHKGRSQIIFRTSQWICKTQINICINSNRWFQGSNLSLLQNTWVSFWNLWKVYRKKLADFYCLCDAGWRFRRE